MKGIGNEFERIEEIKKTNAQFIIPINFPVDDLTQSGQPNGIDRFTLLESAPTNLKVLTDNGIVLR
jgi:hypothetical protein